MLQRLENNRLLYDTFAQRHLSSYVSTRSPLYRTEVHTHAILWKWREEEIPGSLCVPWYNTSISLLARTCCEVQVPMKDILDVEAREYASRR